MQPSLCVFPMGRMDAFFLYCAVDHRRIQLLMAQKFFDLLDRHPPVEKVRGYRPPEPVGMDIIHFGPLAQLTEHMLHPCHCQPVVGPV